MFAQSTAGNGIIHVQIFLINLLIFLSSDHYKWFLLVGGNYELLRIWCSSFCKRGCWSCDWLKHSFCIEQRSSRGLC